ncbi:YceI family protein [Cytophaga aurantiaca]|uniref:YceI family protein n=1 Tax=Cytophaga aurantiaca TaxID=29530 RepID=UPI000377EE6B|nr:YceI family protein [Cytophaga aurantiaca]
MKNVLYSVLFVMCALPALHAQVFATGTAKTSFYSTARLENIEATSKKTTAVINTATNQVLFKILISSFVFKNGLMQEHFNETYMESDKYPYAQFEGKINEHIDYTVEGEYPVTVTGTLLVHGVEVVRTISGKVKVSAGSVTLSADFVVNASAHKIDIPKDKISNIAQDIKVSVYATCIPYVAKK